MSFDKYAGIGGSYTMDASGNRIPDTDWPDRVLAENPGLNYAEPVSEEEPVLPVFQPIINQE